MMTDDPEITIRLQMPADVCGPVTAICFVRRYYDSIKQVRSLDPRERKSWEQIGRDLRPLEPFPGGTVGRAFARVTAERFGLILPGAKTTRVASQIARIPPKAEVPASTRPTNAPTLFSRVVDPIRLSNEEEG